MKRFTLSLFCLLLAIGHASAFDPKNKKPPQPAPLSPAKPLPPPVPMARKPAAATQSTGRVATIVAAPTSASKATPPRLAPAIVDKKKTNVMRAESGVSRASPAPVSLSPNEAMRRSEELKNETAAALAKLDELNKQVAERGARRKAAREAGGF